MNQPRGLTYRIMSGLSRSPLRSALRVPGHAAPAEARLAVAMEMLSNLLKANNSDRQSQSVIDDLLSELVDAKARLVGAGNGDETEELARLKGENEMLVLQIENLRKADVKGEGVDNGAGETEVLELERLKGENELLVLKNENLKKKENYLMSIIQGGDDSQEEEEEETEVYGPIELSIEWGDDQLASVLVDFDSDARLVAEQFALAHGLEGDKVAALMGKIEEAKELMWGGAVPPPPPPPPPETYGGTS